MKSTQKDQAQDELIAQNAERITRNEEAIKRQTLALEQIRDHYYPPPESIFKKCLAFSLKVICVIVAYLGIAQTVDWIWNVRQADARAAQYVDIARRLFAEEGDASGAIVCYEKALELNPKASEVLMALAFMKGMAMAADFMDNDRLPTDAEQVRIDAALSEAMVMRELDPENPMPHLLVAQALGLSGEHSASTAAVERAVACVPNSASMHVSACAMQFFSGSPVIARQHLEIARRLDASLPLVGLWDGMLKLWIDRDAAAAAESFRLLIRRVPRLPLAHAMLARALLAGERPDLVAVRSSFRQALLLDARLTNAMLGIAETYEREGGLVLARLWLDRALAVDPRYLPALVARARIYVQTGEAQAAVADLNSAIALASFNAQLYRLRAEAYEQVGDAAKAKSDRATAAALTSSDAK